MKYSLLSILPLISCLQTQILVPQRPTEGTIIKQISTNKESYEPSDDDLCNKDTALVNLSTMPFKYYMDDGVQTSFFDFGGISGYGLKTKDFIFLENGKIRITYEDCEFSSNQAKCKSSKTETISQGNPISICRTNYPLNYVEDHTITVAASLIHGINQYNKIGIYLKHPIQVQMFLQIISIFKGKTETKISKKRNSAYWATYSTKADTQSITFLNSTLPLQNKHRYYQSPPVINHELSHAVFFQLMPNFYKASKAVKSNKKSPSVHKDPDARVVDRHLVISAFNEGFADLAAYYIGRGLFGNLAYDKYRLNSRNVVMKLLKDDQTLTKALSLEILQRFLYSKKMQGDRHTPNLQDIHTIGAIFAYNIRLLLLTTTNKNEDYTLESLDLLVNLLKYLNSQYQVKWNLSAPEMIFFLLHHTFDYVRLKSNNSITKEQCKIFQTGFPILMDQPQDFFEECSNI